LGVLKLKTDFLNNLVKKDTNSWIFSNFKSNNRKYVKFPSAYYYRGASKIGSYKQILNTNIAGGDITLGFYTF